MTDTCTAERCSQAEVCMIARDHTPGTCRCADCGHLLATDCLCDNP